MKYSKISARALLVLVVGVVFAAALVGGIARAASGPPVVDPATEFSNAPEVDINVPNSPSASSAPRVVPGTNGVRLSKSSNNVLSSWEGVNFVNQRTADSGNQFSLEPPDQGLCVGNGYVVEPVNDAFAIYTTSGVPVGGVEALNPFFKGDHAVVRSTPAVFGTFISDPKCYWDPGNGHFYFTVLALDRTPRGAFTGQSHVLIAVSRGVTPTTDPSDWWHYDINTTNDGAEPMYAGGPSTAQHNGCPCLGDQPLIGADKYGFYITTNEFSLFGPEFNGAQFYAMDKNALAAGTQPVIQYLPGGGLEEGPSYSVQPATSPTAGSWDAHANGTQYFLSALDFNGTTDNRIAIWSFTNTQSLQTATPAAILTHSVMPSEVYATPSPADQKNGHTALGAALGEPQGLLNSNDDRMNQVVYAAGLLWSGVNSEVRTSNGAGSETNRVGIAYFIVKPTAQMPATGVVQNQGYVSTKQDNVLFPSIGVNASGKGVMTFTVVGQNYYPSAAYVPISASGVSDGSILALGGAPEDGFTCYPEFTGSNVCRWGDYSAAVATPAGDIFVAAQWNKQLTFPPYLANWSTYVADITP